MSASSLRIVPIRQTDGYTYPSSHVKINIALLLTLARIPLVVGIGITYLLGAPWISVSILMVFIGIDVYDGDLARSTKTETSLRRLMDGTIDRLSVHSILAIVINAVPEIGAIWLALAIRDIAQAIIGAHVMKKSHVIAAGSTWHRTYTLSLACWGSLVMISNTPVWIGALLSITAGVLTLIDYSWRAMKIPSRKQ